MRDHFQQFVPIRQYRRLQRGFMLACLFFSMFAAAAVVWVSYDVRSQCREENQLAVEGSIQGVRNSLGEERRLAAPN